jgi:hypothetical protein
MSQWPFTSCSMPAVTCPVCSTIILVDVLHFFFWDSTPLFLGWFLYLYHMENVFDEPCTRARSICLYIFDIFSGNFSWHMSSSDPNELKIQKSYLQVSKKIKPFPDFVEGITYKHTKSQTKFLFIKGFTRKTKSDTFWRYENYNTQIHTLSFSCS